MLIIICADLGINRKYKWRSLKHHLNFLRCRTECSLLCIDPVFSSLLFSSPLPLPPHLFFSIPESSSKSHMRSFTFGKFYFVFFPSASLYIKMFFAYFRTFLYLVTRAWKFAFFKFTIFIFTTFNNRNIFFFFDNICCINLLILFLLMLLV